MSEPIAIRQRRKRASTWHIRLRRGEVAEGIESRECGVASWSCQSLRAGGVRGNGGHAECCRVSLFRLCYKLKP